MAFERSLKIDNYEADIRSFLGASFDESKSVGRRALPSI